MKLILLLFFSSLLSVAVAQTVVIPKTATETERKAGQELVEHLSKAAGHKVPLKQEGEAVQGPIIYVGKTKFAIQKGITFDKLGKEEWLIKSFGNALVVGGGEPRGVVYGALELLDRQFGIMWLDERFTFIPSISEITWTDNLDLHGKPAFDIRGIYAYHRDPQDARRQFMARNRQNLFFDEKDITCAKQWGVSQPIGSPRPCHTYYNYTKEWGPENEECLSLSSDGKRLRAVNGVGPGQICFSNPKTRELFSAKLREFIKSDRARYPDGNYPVVYDVSANDNDEKCVCPACLAAEKKYGSYSGLVLEFTNALADSIARDYPDVVVQMFAYRFTRQAPKNIKARPNVLIRLAQLGTEWNGIRDSLRPLSHKNNKPALEQFLEWSKIGNLAIWDYWIIYRKDVEVSSCTQAIAENLRFYSDHNVKSVFVEVEKPLTTSFYPLRIWLGLRLMNNPDLNLSKQIEHFMRAYYGQAAPFMQELLQYLEKINSELAGYMGDIPLMRRTDLDDAFFAKADDLLDKAEKAVGDNPDYLRHIAKERAVIDYVRLARRSELKPFNRDQVMKRLEKNYRIACEDYLSKGKIQDEMNKLQVFFDGVRINIPAIKKFKGADVVIDLAWPQFKPLYGSKLIEVTDAAGGKALALQGDILYNKKHNGTLQFGFYDVTNKKHVHTITVNRQSLPQDEKFHFYPIGKIKLSPKSYVWAHWSWKIQRLLDEFYDPTGLLNDYQLFISIKVQGPIYVPGSKKEDAVMVDRILLTRAKNDN